MHSNKIISKDLSETNQELPDGKSDKACFTSLICTPTDFPISKFLICFRKILAFYFLGIHSLFWTSDHKVILFSLNMFVGRKKDSST